MTETSRILYINTHVPFGNVSVLAVGDLFQLPPVHPEQYIFGDTSDDLANVVGAGWNNFKLIELDQIMRQKDDQTFAEMLNRIREAKATDKDIEMLKSREISPTDPSYPEDALHVYADNKSVNERNAVKLESLNTHVYKIKAKDTKKDIDTRLVTVEQMPKKLSETGGLWEVLQIAVGAQVMLTVNVDVEDGLVNGARGIVKAIEIDETTNEVLSILVKFKDPKVGARAKANSPYKDRYPDCVPIGKHETKISHGRKKLVTTTRVQFPLTLAWALTIHKVQGLTTDQIVVSMKGRFNPGQAYVAFSRVKTLSGLFITSFNATKIRAHPDVVKEMSRLREHCALPKIPEPCIFQLPPSAKVTKIGLLNTHGYLAHLKDITEDVHINMLDIVAFTETHLNSTNSLSENALPMSDCHITRADRPGEKAGGGILVGMKNEVTISTANTIRSEGLESVSIMLQLPNSCTKLCLVVLYRPPSMSMNRFMHHLKVLTSEIQIGRASCRERV